MKNKFETENVFCRLSKSSHELTHERVGDTFQSHRSYTYMADS